MRSRGAGMWWGVAIEAPDPERSAAFYAELLDWSGPHRDGDSAIIAASPQGPYLVFQRADDYQRPTWPPRPGDQHPMMHLDFQVGDLDASVADALALGAVLAADQPRDNVRVLLDPAGRPFCLCLDD